MEYQQSVFLDGVPVMAVEAGSYIGWREYAHVAWAMRGYGASGPAKDVFAKFGFTVDNIAKKAKEVHEFYTEHPAHNLLLRPF